MGPLNWIPFPSVSVLIVGLLFIQNEKESKSCALVPFGSTYDVATEFSNNLLTDV